MTTSDTITPGRTTPLRLGGFHRVSRVGGRDDKLRSPDFAKAAVDRWIESEGARLLDWRVSLDSSGAKSDEDVELEELIRKVESGELDGIVVAKLDRLSRLAPRRRLDLLERIGQERLFSATESNDLATPEGRMVRELFFLLARMEWEKAADNLAAAKAAAIERGAKLATRRPFGYRYGAGHVLEPVVLGELVDETEGIATVDEPAVVVELFELRSTGASYRDVLDLFEARSGRSSSAQTVAYMLANPVYVGRVEYGRRADTRLVKDDAHPAIVELELFELVQSVNAERGAKSGRAGGVGGRPTSYLGGIATCEACGGPLARSTNGHGRGAYRCADPRCARRASIGQDVLDSYVVDAILAWAGPLADEAVEVELAARGDRVVAEHRLAEGRRLRLAWAEDVERELRDAEGYRAGLAARDRMVEELEAAVEACGEASELEVAKATLRELLTGEPGDELELDELRRLFRIVLESVVVRRTPSFGAPASERVVVRIAGATVAPESSSSEDALDLGEKAAA